ncbi:MAG: hypothetical protein QOJ00_1215 [Actinomycetota bacterium]
MSPVRIRPATFSDAKAIDAIVDGFSPLRRDLDAWVNQADVHAALVDDDGVVGFAARRKHKEHPQRDLVAVYVEPRASGAGHEESLLNAVRAKKPLKMRVAGEDYDTLDLATRLGFTERIRSATHQVHAGELLDPIEHQIEVVEGAPRDVADAFEIFYANTHRWDPPATFTRRYIRQAMLNGSQHLAVIRDDDGLIVGVGAAHASSDDAVAADVALVGALDPTAAAADALTRSLVAHLAAFYVDDRQPLWFEIDHGFGTNEPLARIVDRFATPAQDEVVIYTND